eukprot:TRINITY_DN16206_c0_g1_i1.p1 TRINITY_DN16206_c0_g1~~TRINITY_DN16206_c0_g1_i1.p1  ORF type:complete len:941 (+),score=401.24 TRINITY_DN16206_c0_g1_i1:116-2938(+)
MGQPSEQQLQEVARVFTEGINGPLQGDLDATRRVNEFIQQHKPDPTFNACLGVIATSPQSGVSDGVRQQAAIALKNSVVQLFDQAVKPILGHLQGLLIGDGVSSGLADKYEGTSKAIASCISNIAKVATLAAWPTLVPSLWQQLQAATVESHRVAVLTCIKHICEDCAAQLDTPLAAGQVAMAESLLPELVKLLSTSHIPREIELCLEAIFILMDSPSADQQNSAIACKTQALLQPLLQALSRCIEVGNSMGKGGNAIRRNTLRCYRMLLWYYDELKTLGALQTILPLIYTCTNEDDHEVALASCEFWGDMVNNPNAVKDIVDLGLLAQLLEQLLNKMVYSDMEIAMLMDEESRDNVNPPRSRRSRHHMGQEEEDDDTQVEQWTLRKCAAATLDVISGTLQEALLSPPGLPQGWFLTNQIQGRLQNSEWRVQEAAVLALGAVAHGLPPQHIMPHLPSMIELLLGTLSDVAGQKYHFLVRSISCWTLSRYDDFICNNEQFIQYYDKYLELLLVAMTDTKRKVQECAVSAFAELVDRSQHAICEERYLEQIVKKVTPCWTPGTYTTRNLVILLDAVGHLVRTAGTDINTPAAQQCLFGPLIRTLLPHTRDDDYHLMPQLLYCIFNIIHGLGAAFAPYVEEVFQRALSMIGQFFMQQWHFAEGKCPEPPDGDNCYIAFDIIGALVQAMEDERPRMEALLSGTRFPGTDFTIFQLALLPFANPAMNCDKHVKMAGMGFMGESLRRFPQYTVVPSLEQVPAVLRCCDQNDDLCNDCCWFCGEIALVLETASVPAEQAASVVGMMANILVPVLTRNEWHANLLQNCSIAVGRFGLVQPAVMSGQLSTFLVPLCENLGQVRDTNEKEQGFMGMMRMLQQGGFNVLQDSKSVQAVLSGFASFRERSDDLTHMMVTILEALKRVIPPADWPAVKTLAPPGFPQDLARAM